MGPKASTVFSRTAGATFAGAVSFVLSFAQTAVLVPIVLTYWGSSRYGMWLALGAFVNLLQSLDVGHQTFVGNELNILYFQDLAALRRVLASAVRMAWLLGALALSVITGLALFSHLGQSLGVEAPAARNEHLYACALILVATWAIAGSVGGVLARLYNPAGMLTTAIRWSIAARVLATVALAACAFGRLSLLSACLISSAATLTLNAFLFRQMFTRFSALRPFSRGAEWRTGWLNLSKSLVVTSSSALVQLQTSWLIMLIGGVYGAAVIPCFTTMRTLSNSFMQCTSILSTATYPEITRYHAKREPEKLLACLASSWFLSSLGVNILIVGSLPWIEALYHVWTRGVIAFDRPLYLLLVCAISLRNFGSPLTNYLAGINDLRAQASIATCQTLTVVILTLTLLHTWKLAGVGLAILAGEFIASVVLALMFGARQMRGIAASLPTSQLVITATGVVEVLAVCLGVGVGWMTTQTACALGVAALSVTALMQWRWLPSVVRATFLGAIRPSRFIAVFSR